MLLRFLLSVALALTLSAPGLAPFGRSVDPGLAPVGRPAALAPATANWTIAGRVVSYTGLPVVNSTVVVADRCPSYPDANDYPLCTTVSKNVTTSTGSFAVSIAPVSGGYWVYNEPAGTWGGNYEYLAGVSGSVSSIRLSVWPYLGYGNATIVLPNFASLSAYAYQATCDGCNYQDPILSWTGDGVFYVTTGDQLVDYDLATRTTRVIAAGWTPLYQQIMSYGGMEDTEFATPDSSIVYTAGCLKSCTDSSDIEFEAVNTTTGRMFFHNFTGVTVSQLVDNFQFNVISFDGNYSTAVVFNEDGDMYLWNLWTGATSTQGPLPFFEANNVYWMPTLNAFFDQSCDGTTNDQVAEWAFNGASLRQVALVSWYPPAGVQSNGLGGPMYNITAHDVLYEAGYVRGNTIVVGQIPVDPQGVLENAVNYSLYPGATYPGLSVPKGVMPMTPNHRQVITAWGPTVSAMYSPMFTNSSWAENMQTGVGYSTNATIGDGIAAGDVGGYFYNASYIIAPTSTYCDGTSDSPVFGGSLRNWSTGECPLLGTYPGTSVGTIWWLWQVGLPEFPFPADAPVAQEEGPEAPNVTVAATTNASITLAWSPAAGDPNVEPILNFTLFWEPEEGGSEHAVSLPPQTRSYTVSGLPNGTAYDFELEALNQHWFSPFAEINATTVPYRPPKPFEPPADFRAVSYGSTYINYSWTDPDPGANSTLDLHQGEAFEERFALGPATGFNATGLKANTTYAAVVLASNATEVSLPSAWVNVTTRPAPVVHLLAPVDFAVDALGTTYIAYRWQNPNGETAITFTIGAVGAVPTSIPIGPQLAYNATDLVPGTTYAASVSATNGSLVSPPSPTLENTTLALAPAALVAPEDLRALVVGPTYLDLAWSDPNTDAEVTLYLGLSGGAALAYAAGGADALNVTGLAASTIYASYAVAARGTNRSASSPTIDLVTAGAGPAPGDLRASALNSSSVLLTWLDPAGPISNVTIYRGAASTAGFPPISAGLVDRWTVGGLSAGASYEFAVQSWNGTRASPITPWVSVLMPPARGGSPAGAPADPLASPLALVLYFGVAVAAVATVGYVRRRRRIE